MPGAPPPILLLAATTYVGANQRERERDRESEGAMAKRGLDFGSGQVLAAAFVGQIRERTTECERQRDRREGDRAREAPARGSLSDKRTGETET